MNKDTIKNIQKELAKTYEYNEAWSKMLEEHPDWLNASEGVQKTQYEREQLEKNGSNALAEYIASDNVTVEDLLEIVGTGILEPQNKSGVMTVIDSRGHRRVVHGVTQGENDARIGAYEPANNGRFTLYTESGPYSMPWAPQIMNILDKAGYTAMPAAHGSVLDGETPEPYAERAKFNMAKFATRELIKMDNIKESSNPSL